jgi:hypothetical protein
LSNKFRLQRLLFVILSANILGCFNRKKFKKTAKAPSLPTDKNSKGQGQDRSREEEGKGDLTVDLPLIKPQIQYPLFGKNCQIKKILEKEKKSWRLATSL